MTRSPTDHRLVEQAKLLREAEARAEARRPMFTPLRSFPKAPHPTEQARLARAVK